MSTSRIQHEVVPQHRCTAYFSGRVQGVGFRYTAQNLALRYNVQGYVKNLADGRVELVVEGPDGEIDYLVQALQERMTCYIRKVDLLKDPATGEFERFSIRH